MNKTRASKWISLGIVLGTAVVLVVSLWSYLSPHGTKHISFDVADGDHPLVEIEPGGRLHPAEKNLRTGDTYRRMTDDLVYMHVKTQRPFTNVDMTLRYKNPKQPVFEAGLLEQSAFGFARTPLELREADKAFASSDWIVETNDDHTLLAGDPSLPRSLDELASLSPVPETRTYGSPPRVPAFPYLDPSYEPQDGDVSIDVPLRGTHVIATYVRDEVLAFDVDWTDMNRSFDADGMTIEVRSQQGEVVGESATQDDGVVVASGVPADHRTSVRVPNLEEGMYFVRILTTNDALITRIRSDQHVLAFKDTVFLAGSEEYADAVPDILTSPTVVRTTALAVSAAGSHAASFQTVSAPAGTTELSEINSVLRIHTSTPESARLARIDVPKNDLHLTGKGWYGLNSEPFDPGTNVRELSPFDTFETTQIFLLPSDYAPPKKKHSGRKIASASFEVGPAHIDEENDEFVIALSAPGFAEGLAGDILLEHVDLKLTRPPVTVRRILEKLKAL